MKIKKNHPFFNKGENHPSYKNGTGRGHQQSYNKKLRLVFDDSCNRCELEDKTQVHHRDKNPRNNKLENIEFLCKRCHYKAHEKLFKMGYSGVKIEAWGHMRKMARKRNAFRFKMIEYFGTGVWFTAPQLGEKTKRTRDTIRLWRNAGRLEYMQNGGRYYYPHPVYLKMNPIY